jgi:phospholipase/carboxylesterase
MHRFSNVSFAGPHFVVEGTANCGATRMAAEPPLHTGPVAIYRPEGYEPNYAYPLVVWFHDAGEDERALPRLLPRISERNALGLALRGERVLPGGGFDWEPGRAELRAEPLARAVRRFRREFHVHTERVVLAGTGAGAAAAAELFFARPQWFGGLALVDPPADAIPFGLPTSEHLMGKPVLLDVPIEQLGRGRDGASRLAAAGLEVTFRHARTGGLCPATLRHLNRWLIGAVCRVAI